MTSHALTVEEYLAELPEDRRHAIQAVRDVINQHRPKQLEEGMQYGMIGWYLPHSLYPDGYHCDPKQPLPCINVASQKNFMAVYLFCLYNDPEMQEEFVAAYRETGKRLDMGKSCVRFKKIEDFPLEVLAKTLDKMDMDDFLARYEAAIPASKKKKKA